MAEASGGSILAKMKSDLAEAGSRQRVKNLLNWQGQAIENKRLKKVPSWDHHLPRQIQPPPNTRLPSGA
jgi:hypothetical protein